MTPGQGVRALGHLVGGDRTTVTVGPVDWGAFRSGVVAPQPLLAELGAAEEPAFGTGLEPLEDRVKKAPAGEREGLLAAFLQSEVQEILRLASPPPLDAGFFDLGMDSLMAVELRNRLNRALSGAWVVPNTAAFDYPNIGSLAGRLAAELGGAAPAPARARRLFARPSDERIAVVGMACRFPGGGDLRTFWEELASGRDAVCRGRPDDLMLALPGRNRRPGVRMFRVSTVLTRSFSGSRRWRRNCWTRSNGCCWR